MRCLRLIFLSLAVLAGACSGAGNGTGRATGAPEGHALSTTTTGGAATSTSTSTSSTAPGTVPPAAPAGPSSTATSTTAGTVPPTSATAPPGTTPTTTSPAGPAPLGKVGVRLSRLADLGSGFGPLGLAQRPGDDTLFVVGKRGRVVAIRGGEVDPKPVLDITGQVSTGGEQGLLGVAFSPDGTLLYVSFTDSGGDSHLLEVPFNGGRADWAARRELMSQSQPFGNHNGGQVTFGPDGLLYWFLGDGGAANDPAGNAQNLGTWLGKILRIDPKPSGNAPYTVPRDNPFVGRSGAKPEIYSYGLRNPWRASFDRETGDLWIGDVGQNAWEEIDGCPKGAAAGANFGWAAWEGTHRGPRPLPAAEGHVPPVYEYPTSDGCSVTGGYVYRGSAIPGLTGAYLFGDYCNGKVQAIRVSGTEVVDHADLGLEVDGLASFGEDHHGEVYVLALTGGVYRIDPA